jgi:hypothetical protein
MNASFIRMLTVCASLSLTAACVTSTVDEMTFNEPTEGIGDSSVVILGRRHSSDYETEPDFVACVGDHITSHDKSIRVIDELEFLNAVYPWFEPRTAPLYPKNIEQLLQQQPVAEKMRTDGAGSMACSFNGCFGFGTWGHDANYEATIWDFTDQAEVGQVNTSASGQSYMPAVIIPIPIIAPVQGAACDGIGDQLLEFLSSKY